jgi:hypothetical protein
MARLGHRLRRREASLTDPPDFRTVSEFRRRHLKALGALFTQILHLCETAGLVKLGHVALDGTKIKANASKHKAMSYERMEKRAAELEAEVARWLEVAEASDAEEDKLHEQPLPMRRVGDDETKPIEFYDPKDPSRFHIMPKGVSSRGSAVWLALVRNSRQHWVERRDLADRLLSLLKLN